MRPPLPTPSTRRTRLWLVVLPIPDPESPPFPPPLLPFPPPFSLITRLLSEAGKPPVMPPPTPALALDFLATAVAARDIGYGSGRGLAAVAAFLLVLLPVAALSNKTTTGDGGSLAALACRSVVVRFFLGGRVGELEGWVRGVALNSQPWL